jgi:hypothetical protein
MNEAEGVYIEKKRKIILHPLIKCNDHRHQQDKHSCIDALGMKISTKSPAFSTLIHLCFVCTQCA